MTATVGVAPTRWLAKVAASTSKPDGLRVLMPDALPGALSGVALSVLPGIGPRIEVRLAAAGVHSVEGLWSLSRSALRAIWGNVHGARLWSVMRGVEVAPVVAERGSMAHGRVIPPVLRGLDDAYPIGRYLAVRVARRLRSEGRVADRFWLDVALEGGGVFSGCERCEAVDSDRGCLRVHGRLWDRLVRLHPRARVRRVWVTAGCVSLVRARQLELFPGGAGEARDRAMSRAMDALRVRYGRSVIGFGRCGDGSDPYVGSKIAYGRVPEVEDFWV